MGTPYEFKYANGRIYLDERDFNGIDRAEHTTILSLQNIIDALSLRASLDAAIRQAQTVERAEKAEHIKKLKASLDQKRRELMNAEKEIAAYESNVLSKTLDRLEDDFQKTNGELLSKIGRNDGSLKSETPEHQRY